MASCSLSHPPAHSFNYQVLPVWVSDFHGVVMHSLASWVDGIYYFNMEMGECFPWKGEPGSLSMQPCAAQWTRAVLNSPKHSTPASPIGVASLEPSSLIAGVYISVSFLFLFYISCSINSWLSLSLFWRGFASLGLFIPKFIFHSHLGILEAGQLAGFSRLAETLMTLSGAILAVLKLESTLSLYWDVWVYFSYCLNVAVLCLCICFFAQTFCQILKLYFFMAHISI